VALTAAAVDDGAAWAGADVALTAVDGGAAWAEAGADADGAVDDRAAPTTVELAPPQPASNAIGAAAHAVTVSRERVSEVMGPQP
jgi:hypothetical protein